MFAKGLEFLFIMVRRRAKSKRHFCLKDFNMFALFPSTFPACVVLRHTHENFYNLSISDVFRSIIKIIIKTIFNKLGSFML